MGQEWTYVKIEGFEDQCSAMLNRIPPAVGRSVVWGLRNVEPRLVGQDTN
jgi:hypothetical protein